MPTIKNILIDVVVEFTHFDTGIQKLHNAQGI